MGRKKSKSGKKGGKSKTVSNPKSSNNDNIDGIFNNITTTTSTGKKKISILTVSQLKRIQFLHNLSRMIEYQKNVEIDEWVITNGCITDEDHDKFNEEIKSVKCKIPIKYVASKDLAYRNIGAFRNLANKNASGDILVCMDDDDFYFKDYVKSCSDVLINKKEYELVGCSGMFMYDYGFDTVFRLASFGPNHTVNCCMAYRREYHLSHKYDETRKTGEEMSFLNSYKSRMFQLSPTSALIHMSYADNTFSEKRLNMLNNMGSCIRAPDQAPNIYNPMSSSLESLIKNEDVFKCYMNTFKEINNQKETDIVFYYGHMEEYWNPEDNDLRVYRRRCLDLGREFIKNGFSVSVYGKFKFNELEKDGITFYNLKFWNVRNKCKYFIFVDYTGFIPIGQYERIFNKINCEKMFVDVNSNLFNFYKFVTDYNNEKIQFVLKNPFHIHMNPPNTKKHLKFKMKNIIVPNGINTELFKKDYEMVRDPKRFCWTCKYDNGLFYLLKYFWPVLINRHPDAQLHIYYGFEGSSKKLENDIRPLLLQDGVHHHGRVSHEEIAKEFQRSSFLYYYSGSPNESDCMSVMEALASGCIPIMWNKNVYSCFHGLQSGDIPMDTGSYSKLANKIADLISHDPEREKVTEEMKNSDTIITNELAADMFVSAFNGESIEAEQVPDKIRKEIAQKPPIQFRQATSEMPTSINLQDYVDSSDSDDSDVEYESDSDNEAKEKFIESTDFNGSKKGYIYKNGDKGLGYYKES